MRTVGEWVLLPQGKVGKICEVDPYSRLFVYHVQVGGEKYWVGPTDVTGLGTNFVYQRADMPGGHKYRFIGHNFDRRVFYNISEARYADVTDTELFEPWAPAQFELGVKYRHVSYDTALVWEAIHQFPDSDWWVLVCDENRTTRVIANEYRDRYTTV